ncbi:hypothetical protein B4589_014830 [Halolamina sp. CBA1230]|uniref:hypothetical protein n=1 Tax=Halolamina sp. CBA1230 TaxID=1853690 RepID=UPI0009A20745|nr:hypothetical protein [Halolamina sp. CBA1230]QKY21587.1 hypothetical protein B4589_014830 [Halolamina sp. CBA1230]
MSPKRYLGLVRAGLLIVGVGTLCYGVYVGATLPEPPPDSDGVPAGFAVVFVLITQSAGALLAQVGYALPAGSGPFRFGPLADRSAIVRAAAATAAFVGAAVLLTALGWILPDSLSRAVSGTYAFAWFGAAAGSATGVGLTAVLAVGTGLWRLVRGDPLLGDDG